METTFSYTVKNDKLLPLIWLELSQGIPERDCLTPDETFERYACLSGEAQGRESTPDTADRPAPDAYRRTFSFVMGHETLTLRSVWTARRRGVYRMDRLMLRSGDGFGLSQVEAPCPPSKLPQVLVYPRSVPVDISLFLQDSGGSRPARPAIRRIWPCCAACAPTSRVTARAHQLAHGGAHAGA